MRLCFARGFLDTNHHGTEAKGQPWNRQTVRGWKAKIVRLETFRILSTGNECIQSLAGRRLWVYAPSGKCWNFDVYLIPTLKECQA